MEYLESFKEEAKSIDESAYDFYNIFDLKEFLFGTSFMDEKGFYKIKDLASVNEENGDGATENCLQDTNYHTSGIRLRFDTDSDVVVVKVQLKRKYAHQKMTTFCSSGFDVYLEAQDGRCEHKTVLAPKEPQNIFIEKIIMQKGKSLLLYFPLYNSVERMSVGIKKNCRIEEARKYAWENPIMFYGNSITQGASASRSGNSYPNIVNRILDIDIYNYSFSGACRAEISMLAQLCNKKYSAIVIDYTRNAKNLDEFRLRYEPFYVKFREYYPSIPIILIGAYNATVYDLHIKEIYKKYKQRGDKVFFIDLKKLFGNMDPITFSIDNIHYTDCGMFMVAEKISEILGEELFVLEN